MVNLIKRNTHVMLCHTTVGASFCVPYRRDGLSNKRWALYQGDWDELSLSISLSLTEPSFVTGTTDILNYVLETREINSHVHRDIGDCSIDKCSGGTGNRSTSIEWLQHLNEPNRRQAAISERWLTRVVWLASLLLNFLARNAQCSLVYDQA
jgi:hypothetical protein